MKPVRKVSEPPEFAEARRKGNDWLARNTTSKERPPAHWREFNHYLGEESGFLCGYMALWNTDGTVDHFVSIDEDRTKAYEWQNYRYVAGWVNSSKQNVLSTDILDPCEVEEGWFEVILPTLELVATDKIPADKRARAEKTLQRLPIGRDGRALKKRGIYYDEYVKGHATVDEIRRRAPLIAAAIEKAIASAREAQRVEALAASSPSSQPAADEDDATATGDPSDQT